MSLSKKNSKNEQQPKTVETKTIVIQPVSTKEEKPSKYSEWGYKYVNGKKLVAGLISEIPAFCSGFSAGHDIFESVKTCRKDVASKKDKTACVFKTIGKVALKCVAGSHHNRHAIALIMNV